MRIPQRQRTLTMVLSALLLCCLMPQSATAQRLHTRSYGVDDGLGSVLVFDIDQDQSGRLWLATRRGLIRYDGHSWTSFKDVPIDLVHGTRFVNADDAGHLWAVTLLPMVVVTCRDRDGTLLLKLTPPLEFIDVVATTFALRTAEDGTVHLALSTSGGELALWNGSSWRVWNIEDSLQIVSALVFRDDRLMIGSATGLWRLDPEGELESLSEINLPDSAILGLGASSRGGFWLIGHDWIGHLDDEGVTVLASDLKLVFRDTSHIIEVVEGPLGGVYFGSFEMAYYFEPKRGMLETITRLNGLNSDGLKDILTDREGNVWIANLRGVTKIIGRDFVGFDRRHGLFKDEVTAVLERKDGSIVLGHKGGLTFLGNSGHTVSFPDDRAIGRISDLREGPDGALWIAADRSGLARWTPEDGFTWWGEGSGLPSVVFTVLFLEDGTLWVGARHGLYERVGDHFEIVPIDLETPHSNYFVRRLNLARNGDVLIATGATGAFRYHDGHFQQFLDPDMASANSVYTVIDDYQGRLWVGTSAGLRLARDGFLHRPGAKGPSVSDPVYAILEDGDGRLWFGTDRGVQRWDGDTLISLNSRNGLLGNEINRAALQLDSLGRVWIGTESGVTRYDALLDLPPTAPPGLELAGIHVDGKSQPIDQTLDLGVGPKDIEISFDAMSYVDERGLLFRTWLEGLESGWRPAHPSPLRFARYVNVPRGQYRFHVQVISSDGLESDVVVSPLMSIQSHFWQRVWFLGLMGLLLILGLWSGFSAITGRRYALRLQAEVSARTWELAASEAQLKAKSERLNAVLEYISDAVIVLDADHVVTLSNPGGHRLVGLDHEAIIGRPLDEVLPCAAEWLGRAAPPRTEDIVELSYDVKSGGTRWLEMASAVMLGGDHTIGGTLLVIRDVTDRRQAENDRVRAQRLESLGVLAGGIAHDFNNLLMVILGNASLLVEKETLDGMGHELIESVINAGQRAQQLTEHLLTFARGGAPQRRAIALDSVVNDAVKLATAGTSVITEVELPPDLPDVMADPSQLNQVVSNLLINARQAMSDGGRIRIRGRVLDHVPEGLQGNHYLSLTIEDEGPGIPQDVLDRIFEPYFTTKETGTGLGLAIVYSVISRHGGKIEVCSGANGGTVFEVILPATHEREEAPVQIPVGEFPRASRILFLDDELSVRTVVQRLFLRLGVAVVSVAEGSEAVAVYEREMEAERPFDAVILDLTIPGGMGGLGAFQKIRNINPDVIGIVASGYSDDEVMADPARFGFAASLSKPFRQQELESVLHHVFSEGRP